MEPGRRGSGSGTGRGDAAGPVRRFPEVAVPSVHAFWPADLETTVPMASAMLHRAALISAWPLLGAGSALGSPCFVGTPGAPPAIEIASVPAARCTSAFVGQIVGRATNVDTSRAVVVLYAETNAYYCQPFEDARRYTAIRCDGTFRNDTRGGCRYWAVLADAAWDAPCTLPLQPPLAERFCSLPNDSILALACSPCPRPLAFGLERPEGLGVEPIDWSVKAPCCPGVCLGPDRNSFSDRDSAAWVDGAGLHLRLTRNGATWHSAEVIADSSRGHTTYTFHLTSRVDSLPRTVVFGAFTYEREGREIDIECAGDALIPGSANCQYVVQPYFHPGNLHPFVMPPIAPSSHRFRWSPDSIAFVSWRGLAAEPRPEDIIARWTYTGPDIPPAGCERFHFNLWLKDEDSLMNGECYGDPPANGAPVEVVIQAQAVGLGVDHPGPGVPGPPLLVHPNAPNPFTAGTTIRFETSARGRVRVEIVDPAGRRVRTLLDEVHPAGSHTASWDGRSARGARVPAGVYSCRVTLDGRVVVRRMLKLR